ncbi:uncharacterized protein DNG_04795 [Cephalotrichum gorgonifer]|uniref:Uncharacterized protein n=1 Tax=Cephalotrichum gorgonifer TaxID=2041049 RepID=A0AAE8MX41_9PEZI|nr:uncharacterized protein DNG_04795 [Cephalotrichum gorgonifer]
MKGRPVDELVYERMYPKPGQGDPTDFQSLLGQNLIPEVRQEVFSFYGHLDTPEAKYPGLDYCNRIHRIRLSRWPWHRRLFRTFDSLRLTDHEISKLTKWEGTKWAKERYEREQGAPIRDTTADGFADSAESAMRTPRVLSPLRESRMVMAVRSDETDAALDLEQEDEVLDEGDGEGPDEGAEEDEEGNGESDDVMESVGPTLNERLREQVARREAGDHTAVLDEEWEQWLRNALESGGFPDVAEAIFQDLEPTLRRALEHSRGGGRHADDAFTPGEEPRHAEYRRYSELRLPRAGSSLHRTAEARGG